MHNQPHTEESKAKISLAKKGKKPSKKQLKAYHNKERNKKISEAQSGSKSYNWKGDDVGYLALHEWISKTLGKPRYCEHCKRSDRKSYDWSNKDHQYNWILSDWQRLCPKCHHNYDKRFLIKRF